MAEEDIKRCMDWIAEQQKQLEIFPMGTGHDDAVDALEHQKNMDKNIENNKSTINKVVQKHRLSDNRAEDVNAAYETVKNVSYKRTSCLETMNGISSLEDPIQEMCNAFDARAVHLVNMKENNRYFPTHNHLQTNGSLARASQNCVIAVRKNWQWVNTVLQCAQVHLYNAASYHEFFHEVEEAEYWMNTTLSRLHLTFDRSKLTGDRADAIIVQEEIKDVLLAYLQWQTKIESLFDRSKNIVPIPQRIDKLSGHRSVVALTDFKTKQIEFREGESLTLMDNTDQNKWKVKNSSGQEALVPAVIILIPSPSGLAVDSANKLRLQLLSLWTSSLKRLGYQMIDFMSFIFKDWTDEELKAMQNMPVHDKAALLRTIANIREALDKTWNGYGDYDKVKERMARLIKALEQEPDAAHQGKAGDPTAVVQIQALNTLLNKYQDFWDYWETFKVCVEISRQPKLLLVSDKWEDLRYMSTAHVVKFWDTSIDVKNKTQNGSSNGTSKENNGTDKEQEGSDSMTYSSVTLQETPKEKLPAPTYKMPDQKPVEELIEADEGLIVESSMGKAELPPMPDEESSEEENEVVDEEIMTETVESSVQEERQTYVIKGVLDPRTEKFMTLEEAVEVSLIDPIERMFVHPTTKVRLTIGQAMNEGFIQIEMKSRETTKLESKSYGIITLKTSADTRSFTIKSVQDPKTEEELTVTEAEKRGILNMRKGTYKMDSYETLSVRDAISSGLVAADFNNRDSNTNGESPEEVTRTYAVYGVVDQRKKCKVSFREAIDNGLIDRDQGAYVQNADNTRIPVSEAIMRGFIKARVVTDPSKLDVDPSDNVVVDRLNTARSKVLGAMRSARAFKEVKDTTNGNTKN